MGDSQRYKTAKGRPLLLTLRMTDERWERLDDLVAKERTIPSRSQVVADLIDAAHAKVRKK